MEKVSIGNDVLELTRRLRREPNVDTALHILPWELGDLTKSCTYMKWHGPELTSAYKAEAKIALSALLFQEMVIMKLLGIDFQEVIDLGVETVKERVVDMEKKIDRFQHYVGEEKKSA